MKCNIKGFLCSFLLLYLFTFIIYSFYNVFNLLDWVMGNILIHSHIGNRPLKFACTCLLIKWVPHNIYSRTSLLLTSLSIQRSGESAPWSYLFMDGTSAPDSYCPSCPGFTAVTDTHLLTDTTQRTTWCSHHWPFQLCDIWTRAT